MSSQSNRLWVGPLLLILVIALIYIFSLMPNPAPPRSEIPASINDAYQLRALHMEAERMQEREREDELFENEDEGEKKEDPEKLLADCLNGGVLNTTDNTCICTHLYRGSKCQIPICLNHGWYSEKHHKCRCKRDWNGEHCHIRCSGGMYNKTSNQCQCLGRFFGRFCDMICVNGDVYDGKCKCMDGFVGPSCSQCDVAYPDCDAVPKRRGAVNSRLTLSGVSFCMIAIGLLCVTARKRRSGVLPPADDTWYRVFQPAQPRNTRPDYVCGGTWLPRDHVLMTSPGRATLNHGRTRAASRRLATPPPSYTSVDNLNEESSPPSYEEATRREDMESDRVITQISEHDEDDAEGKIEVVVENNNQPRT